MNWEERIGRRLTLRDVRILLTAVELGSVSKAAARLRVSQPAISKTITQMERAVEAPLVRRTTRGVEPTEQGQALVARCRAAMRELRAGVDAMDDLSRPKLGELFIAGNQVSLSGIIPIVISRLYDRHPGVVFHIVSAPTFADQVHALEDERAELVIGRLSLPRAVDRLNVVELFMDDFQVVAGQNHRLASRADVRLADLMDEPWTFPSPETITGQYMTQLFRANGFDTPRVNVIASSLQLHRRLVLESGFLALFPRSLTRSVPGMRVLPAPMKQEPRSIGVLTLRYRTLSPLAKLFIDEALAVSREISAGFSPA